MLNGVSCRVSPDSKGMRQEMHGRRDARNIYSFTLGSSSSVPPNADISQQSKANYPHEYSGVRRGGVHVSIFESSGRVSRSNEALVAIKEAATQTDEINNLATDLELFVQEYGLIAVHLRGFHRETGRRVIVKVGTSKRENYWSERLCSTAPGLAPKVYASGSRLGAIDVHWLASEAIPFGPLGDAWNGKEFELMLDAGIRFYRAAKSIEYPNLRETTLGDVVGWLQGALKRGCPGPVSQLYQSVDRNWSFTLEKCGLETAFDDFHLCNGMTRSPPPDGGPALLIDIHPNRQPWVLDPAYLQVLNSGDRSRSGYHNLIGRMAEKRRKAGLSSPEEAELVTVSKIALGWMAARQWRLDFAEEQPDYREAYQQYIVEAAELA